MRKIYRHTFTVAPKKGYGAIAPLKVLFVSQEPLSSPRTSRLKDCTKGPWGCRVSQPFEYPLVALFYVSFISLDNAKEDCEIPRLKSSTFRYVATETALDLVREMLSDICTGPYKVSEAKAATNMSLLRYQLQHTEKPKVKFSPMTM
jgi:hypothetical protein